MILLQAVKTMGYGMMRRKDIIFTLFLIVVFILAFLIRVGLFTVVPRYQDHADYSRDYLIAHHMVQYKEIPLTGPEGQFGPVGNSPLYYYLIATLLTIRDDVIFFGFTNVVFQMISLLLIYFLARTLFGNGTAVLATLLFGFTHGIILQSLAPWMPHIMQPFVLLSYLSLAVSYFKKDYTLLLGSVFVFVVAAFLHNSVFALAPLFLFFAFLSLWKQKRHAAYYGGVFAVFFGSLIFFYFPVFLYFQQSPSVNLSSHLSFISSFIPHSPSPVAENLLPRIEIFFQFFAPRFLNGGAEWIYLPFGIILFMSTLGYFFYCRNHTQQKLFAAILLVCILYFFLIASFVSISTRITFPPRYFTPIFGLFIIFVAEVINVVFSKKIILQAIKLAVVLLLLHTLSPNLTDFIKGGIGKFVYAPNISTFLRVPDFPNPSVEAIKNEVLTIMKKENIDNPLFFHIKTYHSGYEDRNENEIFWVPLEKDLNVRLTSVNDDAYRDYEVLGENLYVFLICQDRNKYMDENEECLQPFLKNHIDYSLVKKLNPYPIYVTKKHISQETWLRGRYSGTVPTPILPQKVSF